jgi:hypothetical protein
MSAGVSSFRERARARTATVEQCSSLSIDAEHRSVHAGAEAEDERQL